MDRYSHTSAGRRNIYTTTQAKPHQDTHDKHLELLHPKHHSLRTSINQTVIQHYRKSFEKLIDDNSQSTKHLAKVKPLALLNEPITGQQSIIITQDTVNFRPK